MERSLSFTTRPDAGALVIRTATFALIWWAISAGELKSLYFGLPAAVLAALLSLSLSPPPWPRVRVLALLAFVPYFVKYSFLGGADVARRAFLRRMPLAPGFISYPVGRMGRIERKLFALAVNLMPGTLAVRLDSDMLCVHAVDTTQDVHASLDLLETRIASLLGRGRERAT